MSTHSWVFAGAVRGLQVLLALGEETAAFIHGAGTGEAKGGRKLRGGRTGQGELHRHRHQPLAQVIVW